MDKVISARLDEAAVEEMNRVSKRIGMTKKAFLESAIRLCARELEGTAGDVWQDTFGAWARDETSEETHARGRRAVEQSFHRHHKRRRARGR